MNARELARETIRGLADRYRTREVSPVEATQAVLDRIGAVNPIVNAFVTVTPEAAMAQARAAERALLTGDDHDPLLGIPVGIKDVFDTKGVVTSAGSKILAGRIPEVDSGVAARLRAAGAVIVGKTNTHEFAFGGTTQNPHYGGTRNPWNPAHDPGGSSGGSGAAVAAHMCTGAIGSDTSGSVRIPAAACGVVGLRPTFGRVSVTGCFPVAWSTDVAGPMTKSVEDAALMLNVLAGYDPEDASSADVPVPDYTAGLEAGVRGLRVGVAVPSPDEPPDHPDVRRNFVAAVKVLGDLGADLREVHLPSLLETRSLLVTVLMSEGAEVHRRWLEERPGDYGQDVRERLEAGLQLTAAQVAGTARARRDVLVRYRRLLAEVDVLVLPAAAGTALRIGADATDLDGQQARRRDVHHRYFSPFSLIGFPAIALPNGFDEIGLPTGFQIAGRPWDEATVLRVAHAYEQATPWHLKWPEVGRDA